MQSVFTGPVYVVRDNIDTDQIIPAQYLNLVPTIKEEYEKLGSYALCGLPDSLYPKRFVEEGQMDSNYPIVIAGKNLGCGSSREHAPIAMGASMSVVAVLEIHIEISIEAIMKPPTSAMGRPPASEAIESAMRSCRCQRSTHAARIKPPMKRKTMGSA